MDEREREREREEKRKRTRESIERSAWNGAALIGPTSQTCRGCDRVSWWAKWHAPTCPLLPSSPCPSPFPWSPVPSLQCSFATSRSNRPHSIPCCLGSFHGTAFSRRLFSFPSASAHVDLHFPRFATPGSAAQASLSNHHSPASLPYVRMYTQRWIARLSRMIAFPCSFLLFPFLCFLQCFARGWQCRRTVVCEVDKKKIIVNV